MQNDMQNQMQSQMQNEMQNNGNSKPGESRPRANRGFAAMDPERQRQIAREGGRAAHMQGTAHQWTSAEAREAGRKGGQARGAKNSSGQQGS